MGENEYKRRWQIALRRYIIEERPAFEYAPYFGINNKGFRDWIEASFKPGMQWANFGKSWQIDHIVPVSLFNHEEESDLRLCWNFINIYPSARGDSESKPLFDTSNTITYFEEIHIKTGYYLAGNMVEKLKSIGGGRPGCEETKLFFIKNNIDFLHDLKGVGNIEMELINKGMSLGEALIEAKNIRRLSSLL